MIWAMLAFVAVCVAVGGWMGERQRRLEEELSELRVRVNVNDEVITLHSEELDELQRGLAAGRSVRDVEGAGNAEV